MEGTKPRSHEATQRSVGVPPASDPRRAPHPSRDRERAVSHPSRRPVYNALTAANPATIAAVHQGCSWIQSASASRTGPPHTQRLTGCSAHRTPSKACDHRHSAGTACAPSLLPVHCTFRTVYTTRSTCPTAPLLRPTSASSHPVRRTGTAARVAGWRADARRAGISSVSGTTPADVAPCQRSPCTRTSGSPSPVPAPCRRSFCTRATRRGSRIQPSGFHRTPGCRCACMGPFCPRRDTLPRRRRTPRCPVPRIPHTRLVRSSQLASPQ